MSKQSSPVLAAIDVGSNTIHLVVARCKPTDLDILADEVELVRIGESVTATGEISEEKMLASIETLKHYQSLAQEKGAQQIFVIATEAIRQATNNPAFIERVKLETGLEIHLISGAAEAAFTFYGATYSVQDSEVGVMDLGGGSLELVTSKNKEIAWRTSVPLGSGWLHDRYLPGSHPSYADVDAARTFLITYFQRMTLKQRPSNLIVTGGSANSLLLLARTAFGLEVEREYLSRDELLLCEGLLLALPAEEIADRYQQPVARARILLSGTLIIRTLMERMHLNEIQISPHGIREGALLAYMRFGEQWLTHTEEAGTGPSKKAKTNAAATLPPEKRPFVDAGRSMLRERLTKFLEWREEVLESDDIEAVHKMRVASRRLRATLDAYELCCSPKPFKKLYALVKNAADTLGGVRDTDVMISGLQTRLTTLETEDKPGIDWLTERLMVYREQRQQALEDLMKKLDDHKLQQLVEACIPEGA